MPTPDGATSLCGTAAKYVVSSGDHTVGIDDMYAWVFGQEKEVDECQCPGMDLSGGCTKKATQEDLLCDNCRERKCWTTKQAQYVQDVILSIEKNAVEKFGDTSHFAQHSYEIYQAKYDKWHGKDVVG